MLTGEHKESDELLERERALADVQAELVSYALAEPGPGLHSLAEERQADLIVVGSCGPPEQWAGCCSETIRARR